MDLQVTVNKTLEAMGLIDHAIPWLSDVNYARMTCVLVNLWAGFPYFMMLIAGQMTAISTDIFEAAAIDGANKFQIFKSITLPMVLYQTVPLIIMSFTHNVNNFGVIYFLTGGAPNVASSTTTKSGWYGYRRNMDLQTDYGRYELQERISTCHVRICSTCTICYI